MNIKLLRGVALAFSVALVVLLPGLHVNAEPEDGISNQSSLTADFANRTFNKELNDGSSIFNRDPEKREEYNNKIIQGGDPGKLSLYDRFGGDIKFIPYFGEKKFKIGMADKVYSGIKENNHEFTINVMDIFKKSGAEVNNVVYPGRPDIISQENVDAGFTDPRYSIYSGLSNTGGDAALGNAYLTLSRMITEFVTYMSGSGIFNDVNKAWDIATSTGLYELFSNMVNYILPLLIVFFVMFLARGIMKMSKGNESIGNILIKTLSFAISLGIIYSVTAAPDLLKPITTEVAIAADDLFAATISKESAASEIAESDDKTNILQATIWSKTVLDPWAKGMFDGRKYNELYTQHTDKGKSKKMPQSNENILTEWDDGKKRYGSSTITGDIKVPLGGGRAVQNWAALAWSTQSIYHMDAVGASDEEIIDGTADDGVSSIPWPKADRTPNNNEIYVDDFRWLDAKLDISPGYISTEDDDGDYKKSNPYRSAFVSNGINAAFLSLLLLPILWPAFRKLVALIKVITASARWIYYSLMSIIKPESHEYSIFSNLKNVFLPLYFYFWWSMVIYIMFFLYVKIAGNGILSDILWLILAVIIVQFKPVKSNRVFRDAKHAVKNVFTNKGRKQN